MFIAEDVSKAIQDIRNRKIDLLKQNRDEGVIAYFSGAKLVCKPRAKKFNRYIGARVTARAMVRIKAMMINATANNGPTSVERRGLRHHEKTKEYSSDPTA